MSDGSVYARCTFGSGDPDAPVITFEDMPAVRYTGFLFADEPAVVRLTPESGAELLAAIGDLDD